jgi:carboxymethylenebutenolidase
MSIERLTLEAKGAPFVCDLAPSDGGPGLIVLHEWWGLNDDIRRLAERFASEGFTTIAPDLYGESTAEASRAMELASAMKTERSMEIVEACVEELKRRTARKVGVTGFCLGGAMAFAAAASVPGVACAVPFYGNARKDYMVAERMACPIQAHFAEHDDHIDPKAPIALARDMKARGAHMELFFYDAGHAFMREADPDAYVEEAATEAWGRAIEFLRRELR